MKDNREGGVWLIASPGRVQWDMTIRMTKNKPALKPGEVPLRVEIVIPKALFETPELKTTITVPERNDAIEIDTDQISRAVSAATGMHIVVETIEINAPEEQS